MKVLRGSWVPMVSYIYINMGVSLNGGTTKSSTLVGFSIINHPFWGTTILGTPHIYMHFYPHVFLIDR